jgi:probable phosphoglycerate mutase
LTTFLLVRHASGDHVGRRLAGRAPGAPLNDAGREEAARLASWLAPVPLAAVYSSPLDRARDTAAALAAPHRLPVAVDEAFTELDFGDWTGRSVESLAGDALWDRFNRVRSTTRPPGGELMLEAQARAVNALAALAERHDGAVVAVVSHADVLRAVIAHFSGTPLDLFLRVVIDPASVSTLALHPWGAELRGLNASPSPPADHA